MSRFGLHYIFRYLAGDDMFLSTIIDENNLENTTLHLESENDSGFSLKSCPENDQDCSKEKKNTHNIMADMVVEYLPLVPYEVQEYEHLPPKVKSILPPIYARFGIKNIIERNLNSVNISFLGSLNILLRPELCRLSLEEHTKNFLLLESFLVHKFQRNYHVDKIKNTKKVQELNRQLIDELQGGKISHELIRRIINVFEINLLVFDLTKIEIYLYWSGGYKYPYFNFFKDIYCMSFVQGNYEPMVATDKVTRKTKRHIYVQILANLREIKCIPEMNLALHSLVLLNTWNIPCDVYIEILRKFFVRPKKSPPFRK
ncbi:MAG: hypothetical protein QW303_00780 [Nitrososphaerota archaeon]